ncbi:UNKNOWN [Stylonychia lemnae]|uniref:ApaG domain-containing protein n=1 Tax=Stylonychia lemnae TaxID=5949 RepID=A0A078A4R8_STYLE|nr:UNKNOWN [Stylonychia lemnae]|eukprot:CDW77167.1 UNKNOWN [Stylonychia lemnae]
MESFCLRGNDFVSIFDSDMTSILCSYLNFDDIMESVIGINKDLNILINQKLDIVWQNLFKQEFMFRDYPDHRRYQGESHFQYFKRSFLIYKEVRQVMRSIFNLTNQQSEQKQEGFIKKFKNRKVHTFIAVQEIMSFQYECFYKNFEEKNNQQQNIIQFLIGQNQYYIIENFKLTTTSFYDHKLELCLLSPSSMKMIQNILKQRYGFHQLPLMHIMNYRHSIIVDAENKFGMGHGALIQQGGPDRSVVVFMAPDILSYLRQHNEKLKNQYFFTRRGIIETYPSYPQLLGGSLTVTHGIKIEAVANYIHFFGVFDKSYYNDDTRYFFSYQVRISVDENYQGEFFPSRLKSRTWKIQMGERVQETTGLGVIGEYPLIESGMEPFIYESCCPTKVLGTIMQGHFTFEVLDGPQKGQEITALIDPFNLRLDDDHQLIANPLFQSWMHM